VRRGADRHAAGYRAAIDYDDRQLVECQLIGRGILRRSFRFEIAASRRAQPVYPSKSIGSAFETLVEVVLEAQHSFKG
jgi:hypothetical protein